MNRWVAVLGCLAALMAVTHSAAVPTQDTLVVAKSDDTVSTTPSVPKPEPTTEESSPPIKLTEMDVTSEVSLRYAHTTVVARVRNPAKRAQEANFRVLLPETAFISGFVMTLDGKSYKAYVKEKEEAKQIYQDAVSHGIGAAHIAAKARDSNHFIVNVNVEASSSAVFNLTYEELLVRRNGVYNHAINLHPGGLVPKLTVTVHIKEGAKISELRVPEIRTGNEIDATKDDAQNSKVTIVKSNEDREATITFTPDLQEQERLIQIYAQKSKESAAASQSHYWYQPEPEKEATPEGVLGQFVVQYDVDRPKDGEILVNDGYFVHFFAPSDLEPLNKFVVFVLDTSGSMMDRKIVQLREAMQTILSDLNAGDYFSIVEFSSAVTVHDLNEADREPPKNRYSYFDYDKEPTLVPPSPATPENIVKAKVIVSWLQASGGTNIGKALNVAVELINKGVDWTLLPIALPANSSADITTSTSPAPAEVSAEPKAAKSLEPIIIFLTDGDPTVGETDPKRIINHVQEKNYGENKALIYSLAFGEDADRKFLRKVSLRNGGFMRHIYEAADAALQLRDFYRQISSPLLAHLNFTYPPGQVKADSVTKHTFRNYFKGSEVVVAGRVDHDATELTPHVDAFCGVGRDGYGRKRYEIIPKVPVEQKKSGYLPLERLWSYLTIKQLLDQHDADDAPAHTDKDKENTPEKKALALALKYEFVTPLTSLVVVKPNATNAVDAVSVDKTASSQSFPSSIALSSPVLPGFPAPSGPSAQYSSPIAHYGSSFASGAAGIQTDALLMSESEVLKETGFAIDDYHRGDDDTRMSVHRMGYPSASRLNIVHPAHDSFTSGYYSGFRRPLGTKSKIILVSSPKPINAISSSRPLTTTPRSEPSTTSKPNLSEFGLQNFTWVEPLLRDDSIRFEANSTDVILKLVKDNVPTEASGDAACDRSLAGDAGVCVYLTRCVPARDITLDIYKTAYCTVNTEFAGVCCPKTEVISISQRN